MTPVVSADGWITLWLPGIIERDAMSLRMTVNA